VRMVSKLIHTSVLYFKHERVTQIAKLKKTISVTLKKQKTGKMEEHDDRLSALPIEVRTCMIN
jgi:hypothetical protein